MTTNNVVDTPLSGTTGTGSFVGSTSPTLVTPTLGVATATSLAFSPTTGGIIGTTAADNASAGKVGEVFVSSIVLGSAISITSATNKNLTSITVTAGDWDVFANVLFTPSVAFSAALCGVSTTTATFPDSSLLAWVQTTTAILSGATGLTAPYQRINVNGSTTIYIVANATFAAGTATICGQILARRVR